MLNCVNVVLRVKTQKELEVQFTQGMERVLNHVLFAYLVLSCRSAECIFISNKTYYLWICRKKSRREQSFATFIFKIRILSSIILPTALVFIMYKIPILFPIQLTIC